MSLESEAYLQKHNINNVFKEIINELAIQKPEDPFDFIIHRLLTIKMAKTKISDNQTNDRGSAPTSQSNTAQQSIPNTPNAEAKTGQSASREDTQAQPSRPVLRGSIRTSRRGAISAEPIDVSEALRVIPKTDQQRERLDEALKRHVMFAHLESEEKKSIFDAMTEVSFKQGDVIIRQGDEGDNFYVVEDGQCDIHVMDENQQPKHVAVVSRYGSFGELALIYGSPRAATVTAKTDVTLWAIDRNSYRKVLMKSTISKRDTYETFLEKVPILSQLTKWERCVVADALLPISFEAGQTVVREGDIGDEFFIILDGEANVYQSQGEQPVHVATLSKSSYFGEIALLTNRVRAATVVAKTPLKCVYLNRDRFNRVLGPCEDILRRNMESYNKFFADKI